MVVLYYNTPLQALPIHRCFRFVPGFATVLEKGQGCLGSGWKICVNRIENITVSDCKDMHSNSCQRKSFKFVLHTYHGVEGVWYVHMKSMQTVDSPFTDIAT